MSLDIKVMINLSPHQIKRIHGKLIQNEPFSMRIREENFNEGQIPFIMNSKHLLRLRRCFQRGKGAKLDFTKTQSKKNRQYIGQLSHFMPCRIKNYGKLLNLLTTNDLNRYLKQVKNFHGVYAKDALPDKLVGSGVINLENQDEGGSHWVGYYRKRNKIYFFDSFGNKPVQQFIDKAKSQDLEITYTDNHIQHDKSIMCGWYVIDFILYMNKGYDYFDFQEKYDSSPTCENEEYIRTFARTFMRGRGAFLQ
jgi:hypothetical protein